MMPDFSHIAADRESRRILSQLISRLDSFGYGRMWRIPVYEGLSVYGSALKWEDFHYKWLDRVSGLIFNEAGDFGKYVPRNFRKRFELFRGMLTTCAVTAANLSENDDILDEDMLRDLEAEGFIAREGSGVRFLLRVIPLPEGYIIADSTTLNHAQIVHFGRDSMMFHNYLGESLAGYQKPRRALDMGCGTGVHSLLMKRIFSGSRIVALDINQRAVDCARLNMELAGSHEIDVKCGDWNSVSLSEYDLVICNPPFEWREKDGATDIRADGGGLYGLDKTIELIALADHALSEDGRMIIFTQTMRNDSGGLLLLDIASEVLQRALKTCSISIGVVFEHLLVTPEHMRMLRDNSLSNYVNVVIEIERKAGKAGKSVSIKDLRPLLKRKADRLRVSNCKRFWEEWMRNN